MAAAWKRKRVAGRVVVATAVTTAAGAVVVIGQAPPPAPPPPPPVVIGRDVREGSQVVGKEFALRVRLSDVAGKGIQQVRVVRLAADGTIALPRIAPVKAEGVTLAALEAQVTAAYKAVSPTAAAFISIADRNPPPPPPATTQAATQPTTQPATAPVN